MKLTSLVSFSLFLIPACGSTPVNSTAPDAGSDASTVAATDAAGARSDANTLPASPPDDAALDAPQACNTLVNSAPVVTIQQVASDPPSPEGGTVVDGTYAMTAVVIYTGPSGPTGASGTTQTTLQITGSTIQIVSEGDPATRTVAFTTNGTGIDSVDTCPDNDARPATYTATSTTLMIELAGGTDDAGARTVVETYTKQ